MIGFVLICDVFHTICLSEVDVNRLSYILSLFSDVAECLRNGRSRKWEQKKAKGWGTAVLCVKAALRPNSAAFPTCVVKSRKQLHGPSCINAVWKSGMRGSQVSKSIYFATNLSKKKSLFSQFVF